MRWGGKLIVLGICIAVLLLSLLGAIPCLWRTTFGIPCPGCGMSRAYQALLNGDFLLAWQQHPLFWLVPLVVGICIFKKGAWQSLWLWGVVGGLMIGVYLVRMRLLFPHTPPMDYSVENLLQVIIERIYI